MTDWKKWPEEVPEAQKNYLVWSTHWNDWFRASFWPTAGWYHEDWDAYLEGVTHWMEITPPPQTEEGKGETGR